MGHTHIRLAAANEDVLAGALDAAWKLRTDQNAKARERKRPLVADSAAENNKRGKR